MLNKQDFAFAPTTVTVRLSLQPVYNILNSLVLLSFSGVRAGLPEWITTTANQLTAEETRLNRLLVSVFNTLQPYSTFNDFEAYLQELEKTPAQALVDQYFDLMKNYLQYEDQPVDLLESEAHFLSLVAQMYEKEGEEYEEGIYRLLYSLLTNPPHFKETLIAHLRNMWSKYVKPEWLRNLSLLQESIRAFDKLDLTHLTAYEAIRAVTGRDMSNVWNIEEIKNEIVFVPSAHIGPYLTRFDHGNTSYLLFGARVPEGTRVDSSALSRADLLVQLNALADETRLMILELLTHHEELCAQDIISILNLSQSSASRHLRQLSASGYLIERRREVAKCYSLNIGRIKETSFALNIYLDRKA